MWVFECCGRRREDRKQLDPWKPRGARRFAIDSANPIEFAYSSRVACVTFPHGDSAPALAEWFVAVRSTTIPETCVPPTATTTILRTATTMWVFECCGWSSVSTVTGLSGQSPGSRSHEGRANSPVHWIEPREAGEEEGHLGAGSDVRRLRRWPLFRGISCETSWQFKRPTDINRWMLPQVDSFSRRYKFGLGARLQDTALDLCLALVEASHAKKPLTSLYRANRLLDQLRVLTRLSYDVRLMRARQLKHIGEWMDELGRMLGGWLRSEQTPRRVDRDWGARSIT